MTGKILLASAVALALAACGGSEPAAEAPAQTPAASTPAPAAPSAPAAPTPEPAAPAAKARYFDDAAALRQAHDSLKALPQFGGKPLMVFQNIHFYDDEGVNRIEIDIQDPNKPENIDHYTYKFAEGKWSEPSPVKISGDGDMSANLTALDQIDFGLVAEKVLPTLQQKAEEEKLENIKQMPPTHISFMLWVPDQSRYWQTSIDTDRATYWLRLNADGSLKSFEKQ